MQGDDNLGGGDEAGRRLVGCSAVAPAQKRRPDAPGAVLHIPQWEEVVSAARDKSEESLGGVEAEPVARAFEPHRFVPAEAKRQRLALAVRDCAGSRVVEVGVGEAPTVQCQFVADRGVRSVCGDESGREKAGGAGEAAEADERSHRGDGRLKREVYCSV